MSTFRNRYLKISIVLLSVLTAAPMCAQTPISCTAIAAVPPNVRTSGLSELTGDILLLCTGGTPTPTGVTIPGAVNIMLSFNTPFAGRLLAQTALGDWTEALLLVGEPPPPSQLVCGAPAAPEVAPGICAVTGNNGVGVYSGAPGRPNVFQGVIINSNTLAFRVPFDPPGSQTQVLRIVNTRVNASLLGPPGALPIQVTGTLEVNAAMSVPIGNPTQIIGFATADMSFSLNSAPPVFQQSVPQNQDLARNTKKDGTSQFSVRVVEGFPNAFKQRTAATYVNANTSPAPASQNTPGLVINSESGFFNLSFPAISGRGNLGRAGLADFGTRIAVRFSDVPAGVSLFTDAVVNLGPAAGPSGVLRRVDSDAGAFAPSAAGNSGIVPVSIDPAGTGVAVYEVLKSNSLSIESADIPVYVAYVSKGNKQAATGTAKVSVYLAPASAAGQSSLTDPLPRFMNKSAPLPAFTIAP